MVQKLVGYGNLLTARGQEIPFPAPVFNTVPKWRLVLISTNPVVELAEKVQAQVKPERYAHILRVAELAAEIAKINQLDIEKTYLAAILHDAARDYSPNQLFKLAPQPSSSSALIRWLCMGGPVASSPSAGVWTI